MADSPGKKSRIDVYCMTYGEPYENDFLPQFRYSLSILNRLTRRVAPIPKFVTPLLAARRALIRKKMFNEMGYNSPLEPISDAQAKKIAAALKRLRPGIEFNVQAVTEFRRPYLPEILEKRRGDPPGDLVILPLYVAESDFTTGVSRTDLAAFHRKTAGRHGLPRPAYLGGFGFDERIGKVCADFVWRYCIDNGWTEEKCRNAALILGAHGTLQYPPEGINSGAKETLYLFGLVREHLKGRFKTVRVAWLNHTLGGKWTFPAVDETAEELREQGVREFVYYPFGFFGDNNESQNEGKIALDEYEWDDRIYLPCVNDDDRFCDLLAEMVLERIDNPMREEWDRIEQGGRRDLIQKVRPAVPGEPGALNFSGPVLGRLAVSFWFLAAGILLFRGYLVSRQIESDGAFIAAVAAALLIGFWKGARILAPVVIKNLKRIRRLPQPSPVYTFFTKATWITIGCMISLGIVLRHLGISPPVYTAILWGVGVGLFYGAVAGILNLREAKPRGIISMNGGASSARPRSELLSK